MKLWRSVVGKLWMTIIGLVAVVLMCVGLFLLVYIDIATFENSSVVKRLFIYTGIIGFTLTTFFAFFLLTKITQPLLKMIKAADSIAQGNYAQRLTVRSSDEIGELAHSFNEMAERLEGTIRDLKHEKEHLDSVLHSMSDAVITFDANGNVVLNNPPGQSILRDWSELDWEETEDGFGKSQNKNTVALTKVPLPLKPLFDKVVHGMKEHAINLHVKNGVWSVVMTPLYAENMKTVRGAVAVLRDVTEEERLNKFRQDFVANVSHELRTPLAMLQGYSEALLDDIASSPEERKELAQIINDESQRMGRLVQDILDLTRLESGHIERGCEDVDLVALAERIMRKFSAMASEKGIHLSTEHVKSEVVVSCADEDQLEQVFTNLIDNAIRHTNSGKGVQIRTSTSNRQNTVIAEIEIKDEGEGISKEDLAFIFDRFYKADKARTRGKASGTGLGLSIVSNILEAHDSTIQVDSQLGIGTTFTIRIPLHSTKRMET